MYQTSVKKIYRKSVLVTGAGGSIGSELCRQLLNLSPASLILVEMNEFALYELQYELEKQKRQEKSDRAKKKRKKRKKKKKNDDETTTEQGGGEEEA